jgi:chromosomal replication initiation ATPase DnaA
MAMTDAPKQLTLDLPHRAALGAEDFLVTATNQAAVDVIDRWPDWPSRALITHGAAGTGKSHLVSVWQSRSGAERVDYDGLDENAIEAFKRDRVLAVEDVCVGNPAAEKQLFHLLNLARESGGSLLLTSALPAGELDIRLPDLRSRLRALPAVALGAPDDALLQGLLVKLFADRQLIVEPTVITYLARHMERSAGFAARLVAEIDGEALAGRRRVTRALAGRVLARCEQEAGSETDG